MIIEENISKEAWGAKAGDKREQKTGKYENNHGIRVTQTLCVVYNGVIKYDKFGKSLEGTLLNLFLLPMVGLVFNLEVVKFFLIKCKCALACVGDLNIIPNTSTFSTVMMLGIGGFLSSQLPT